MNKHNEIYEKVKNYYGKFIQKTSDLKTNTCFTFTKPPQYISNIISLIHEEVENKYYVLNNYLK